MNLNTNLIQDPKKNNNQKNNYSVKGFYWNEKELINSEVNKIMNDLNLDLSIAKMAVSRGISSSSFENFINPKIKNIIPDPFVLHDMKKATLKITEFIMDDKKIGILGDYDVDGSSATALLCNYLSEIDIPYEYYIPDRINEGYGPNIDALKSLKKKGCELILTLDCGTSAQSSINLIADEGIDVIILDHHIENGPLPNAFAIINPKKKLDTSSLNNLCATGVVFFLIVAVNRELKKNRYFLNSSPNLIKYLDLVALATVCDLVKLDNLNRAFVKQGIKIINKSTNIGIKSLIENSSITQIINEYHLGFILGPKINAGGRVGDSKMSVNLLTSKNKSISSVISQKLSEFNNLRKSIEKKVEIEALKQISSVDEDIICVHDENWHPGVIGIVAARITEKFSIPSIVISENTDVCIASCRSVKSYDIGQLIIELVKNNTLLSGGGHKMAGGFKIKRSKINELKVCLRNRFKKKKQDLVKEFDSELNMSLINNKFFEIIEKFSPYGIGNPKPKFIIKECFIKFSRIVGEKHFSFFVENAYGNRIKAISFNSVGTNLGNVIEAEGLVKALIVTLTMNKWGGEENIELFLEDIIL